MPKQDKLPTKKTENKKLKIAAAIEVLKSLDEKKFNTALDDLKTFGDDSVIAVLASLYGKCSHEQQLQIATFISDIRDEEVQNTLVEVILDEKDEATRVAFLSAIWSSGLDFSEYLHEFVRIAIKGTLLDAIECHTIIENLEGPFEEDVVMESKVFIKENMESILKDAQKGVLLGDILLKIEEFDQQLES